jgi:hypothetical protein
MSRQKLKNAIRHFWKKQAVASKKKRSGESGRLALGAAPASSGSDGVDARQSDALTSQAQSTALLFPSSN